ncbi:unnamed protein product [Zymoseptoria tritici ST99CH_1E4]|uniref:MYND-type domain-containing protein n=1 Tax=Zymoseptoria tritici ST99CH_1E4 TaxID=1276532 RepID=A0A2H1H832_ZYMTR|nr:unnamed protein product [Zymoseptoria tritici ST99CH_1E4]
MGAWALTLFSCDYDLDLIKELSSLTGLPQLEAEAGKLTSTASTAAQRQADHARLLESINPDSIATLPLPARVAANDIHYSVYAKLCSDPEKIRLHLDCGILHPHMTRLSQEVTNANSYWRTDPYGPGYQLVMLGCCAMTLGAHLTSTEKDVMRAHYRTVHFMRDAVTQIEIALDPDEGYVNGIPWDFCTKAMYEGSKHSEEDQLFPGAGMMNCWAPDHGRSRDEMAQFCAMALRSKDRMMPAQLAKTMRSLDYDAYDLSDEVRAQSLEGYEHFFAADVCGGCGKGKSRNGRGPLQLCQQCKAVRYCCRGCQKRQWRFHRRYCGN